MAHYAVLITAREILGKEPKLGDLHSLLEKYKRNELIFFIARLNALLGTWQNTPDFAIDAKLTRILLPSLAFEIDTLRRASPDRMLCSRITFLYLIKQACIACKEDGQTPGEAGFEKIGLACLMANDLILPFVPSPQDGTLERLANVLPFSDYIPHDQYPIEIARAERMFEIAGQVDALRRRSDFVDLKPEFENKMGFSNLTFSQLVFGCAAKFLNVRIEDWASPETMILRSTFFQKSALSPEKAAQFFKKITISEAEFAERMRKQNRPGDDFTLFQAYPLIELSKDIYTCLDPGFLVEKAGRGVFWTIFSEMDDKTKLKLLSFWGAVFEVYVNSLLSDGFRAGGRYFSEPKFANGDSAFDACLLEGRRLVVFEHKSSTIRADCKYAGDVAKLKTELHLKFVDGDQEGAKGVAQLNKSLIRFLGGELMEGISCIEVSTIYPSLVCLDNSVSVPYMGRYFNEQFRSVFPRKQFRQTVTPVMTLNISDIENLLGYLHEFKLSDVFDSFYSKNRSIVTPLSTSEIPLLKNVRHGSNVVLDSFADFGKRIEKDLFPQEAASQGV